MNYPVVDAEEQALRDLGRETDLSEGRPVVESSEGAPKPEPPAPPAEEPGKPQPTPEPKPVSSEPEPTPPPVEATQEERDKLGRFKAQDNGDKPPVESVPLVDKPKSQYAEAKDREAKELERKKLSWIRIEEEKQRLRTEQAAWEEKRRMQELQMEVQERPLEIGGYDTKGWDKNYQDFRQRAHQSDSPEDWKVSLYSLENKLQLEKQAAEGAEKRQYSQYELNWRTARDAFLSKNDPDSPLYQALDQLVQKRPYFYYLPNGFDDAVQVAQLLLAAGSDSELRDENEKLRAQLEQYQHSSQPARGGPGKPPQGPRSQGDMSLDEEESFLRDLTNREDMAMRR